MKNKNRNKLLIGILISLVIVGCNKNNTSTNSSLSGTSSTETKNLEHNITIVENENCTITLSKDKAVRDEVITITVTNISEGLELHKITANNFTIDNNSFIMPNEDVEVKVFLKEKSEVIKKGDYKVKVEANEYALIETEYSTYNEGDLVNIEYTCKGYYVLDSFYVNNEKIEGTSFTMPGSDVVLKGTFKYVIDETPWQLSIVANGVNANSYWYFTYGDNGLDIRALVDDRIICAGEYNSDFGWQDNIEIILNAKNDTKGWEINKAHKIIISSEGKKRIQKASSTNAWGNPLTYEYAKFNATAYRKSLERKNGYNGYEVNMFIAYDLFGLTKETALNNMTACLAMRNTNSFGGSSWGSYAGEKGNWSDGSTHPIILENGFLQEI